MTKRTRISKKAQRRRRREFELGALIDVSFDTFYANGYKYAVGVDQGAGLQRILVPGHDPAWTPDLTVIAVYVQTPDNTLILHDMVRETLTRAVYRIQAADYLQLSEKRKVMEKFLLFVLQNANAGQSVWARFMQGAIADTLTDEGDQ